MPGSARIETPAGDIDSIQPFATTETEKAAGAPTNDGHGHLVVPHEDEPKPPAADADDAPHKNISSDALEKSEIDKIAEQLKQRMNAVNPPADKPADAAAKPADAHAAGPGKDDTIFIDKDGTFHLAGDTPKQ